MKNNELIPRELIEAKIYVFRGQKVMLDHDLARLYQVETKVLNQAVRRNSERFPEDFMFRLIKDEYSCLKSQIVTSNVGRGGKHKLPYVFTEHGVAMLSSVLRGSRAVAVNIQIIRTFNKLRELISQNNDLLLKIDSLELRYDEQFKIVFDAIRKILPTNNDEKRPEIGFHD